MFAPVCTAAIWGAFKLRCKVTAFFAAEQIVNKGTVFDVHFSCVMVCNTLIINPLQHLKNSTTLWGGTFTLIFVLKKKF